MAFLPSIHLIGTLDKIAGRNHFLIHPLSRRPKFKPDIS
jgi:hypothetical protein